jgi:hypothetical protein
MRVVVMISRSFRRLLFLASITAGAACAPPLQSGGVEVRTGAAERLELLYRWRHGDASSEGLGDGPEEDPVTSEAGPAPGIQLAVPDADEPRVAPPSPAKLQEK